jgi:hypothetical protein
MEKKKRKKEKKKKKIQEFQVAEPHLLSIESINFIHVGTLKDYE